jgi:transcription antitermination factor NusG
MINEIVPRWYAVHTKYKSEKIVHRLLKQKNIDNFLPLQNFTRKYGRRIANVEIPLISCYIFVNITKTEYVKVLETEYVVGFVRFAKDIIPIPDVEIELMQRIIGEDIDILVEKSTFYEGDDIEIAAGQLTGLRGKLVTIEGKNRMLVELEHLGYTLQLSVEKQVVRKL